LLEFVLQDLQVDKQTKLQTLNSGRLLYFGVDRFCPLAGAVLAIFFTGIETAALDVIPGWA